MIDVANKLREWREHPAQMVEDLFGVTPDVWQAETLEAFPHQPRVGMKACVGPGKTAVLAWLGWNMLLTRPHPMGGAVSVTGANLHANLWPELARWHGKCPLLQEKFDHTSKAIFLKEHPKTWRLEARAFAADADAVQIGNALAGLHAPYVFWLLDETGSMPKAVLPVCEGIFAGDPKEAHIALAGNPETLDGVLYHACVTARDLWFVVEITADPDSPRRTPRVSVEHARAMIKQYGSDNPWVLVRIFGKFPPSSLNALIGYEEVQEAMKRSYKEWDIQGAKILGVDVARQGDDESIIFARQGLQAFPMQSYRNLDSLQGAGQVNRRWNEFQADACFVDATGGFGWGWIDQLRTLGKVPIPIQFSNEAHEKERYYNKRAEMYFAAVEWIRRGGALPQSNHLARALSETTYTFKGERLLLEDKEQVKAKIGFSPDEADAFVVTFAEPVQPTRSTAIPRRQEPVEYDPFKDLDAMVRRSQGSTVDQNYNPFG